VGTGDAQSAADSASHPLATPPSCASPHEGLDLVRCVGDLGHAVSPADGVCGGSGWGGASLLAILHRKPSSLPCALRTSSRPAGRRHGVTGRRALHSAAAFRPPRGRLRWLLLWHGHLAAFLVMRMLTAQTGGAPFSSARLAAVAVPSSSVRMGLGLGSCWMWWPSCVGCCALVSSRRQPMCGLLHGI
jgi:hypothetical protein